MLARIRSFAAFWYDFVIGDDWRVAVAVVIAFAATYGVSRATAAWWVAPVLVAMILPYSLWRAARR